MIVAGIDPGKTGAIAIVYPDGCGSVHRVPLMKQGGKEQPAWHQWAREWCMALDLATPDMVVMEQVGARPGQGVTSMFNFGRTLGFVQGLVAATTSVPLHHVTPTAWKSKLGLLKADKSASREMVRRLLPSFADQVLRVKDDGAAEAILLAYYGRRYLS